MHPRVASTAVAIALGVVAIGAPISASVQASETPRSLIARSKVWQRTDIPATDLKTGPKGEGAFAPGATVTCEYFQKRMSGRSPKFACRLPGDDEVKIKYGSTNGEVYGEVVASRLLWALGFGADRMYPVRVICRGCPDRIGAIRRDNGDRIVDPAVIERDMSEHELVDRWDWAHLDSAIGAAVAERDALKLLAVMLQHTDSKAVQQRIVCLDEDGEGEGCETPMMMIADLGLTFGRANAFNTQPVASVNLAEWTKVPVWKGNEGCIGNLQGSWTGTLKFPVISEEGRRFLTDLLGQLSDRQLHDLFEAARVNLRARDPGNPRSGLATVDEWVSAFKQKRAEIAERSCGQES